MKKQKPLDEMTLKHFHDKLLTLRRQVIEEAQRMLRNFQQETLQSDPSCESLREMNWITECSLLTHEQSLLNAIDTALTRIQEKTYGYCEETGKPISLKRLEAYPMTTLSLEAQQEREKSRRLFYTSPIRHSQWR